MERCYEALIQNYQTQEDEENSSKNKSFNDYINYLNEYGNLSVYDLILNFKKTFVEALNILKIIQNEFDNVYFMTSEMLCIEDREFERYESVRKKKKIIARKKWKKNVIV